MNEITVLRLACVMEKQAAHSLGVSERVEILTVEKSWFWLAFIRVSAAQK